MSSSSVPFGGIAEDAADEDAAEAMDDARANTAAVASVATARDASFVVSGRREALGGARAGGPRPVPRGGAGGGARRRRPHHPRGLGLYRIVEKSSSAFVASFFRVFPSCRKRGDEEALRLGGKGERRRRGFLRGIVHVEQMGAPLVRVDGRRRVRRRPARRATHRRRHARVRRGGALRAPKLRQRRRCAAGWSSWTSAWARPLAPGGCPPLSLTLDKTSARSSRAFFRSRGQSRWPCVVHLLVRAPVANEVHGQSSRRRARRGCARACADADAASCWIGSLCRGNVVAFVDCHERKNLPDALRVFIPDVARVASLDPAGRPEPRALAWGPVARLAGRDRTRLVEARHPRVLARRP